MFEDLFLSISIILGLLMLSAFFSAAETSLTSLSRAKIHKLRMEGHKRAILVSSLRQDKDRLIGSILLGNNAINNLATAMATGLLINIFGDEGIAYATIIITILILIFGEVMPKTYAFANAEKVGLFLAPPIKIIVKVFSPVILVVNYICRKFLRILGVRVNKLEDKRGGLDALRGAIDLHHHEGAVVKQERDMLGSILDLADTEVGEVMVHRKNMTSININQNPQKIINQSLDNIYTRVPVWEENIDNIIGVLNAKDLLRELNHVKGDVSRINIRAILQKPWFIPDTTTLKDQLVAFREKRYHIAFVVDEYGGILGLLTLEDILEEIVGQIEDEHDHLTSGIIKQADGGYMIDGGVSLRDLNRQLDWTLPDTKAATVAGLIIEEAKIIPDAGESFDFYGVHFEVLKKNKNRITLVKAKKL